MGNISVSPYLSSSALTSPPLASLRQERGREMFLSQSPSLQFTHRLIFHPSLQATPSPPFTSSFSPPLISYPLSSPSPSPTSSFSTPNPTLGGWRMTGPAGVVSVNWQRSTHAEALFLKLGQRKGKREKAYVFLSNYSRGRKREKKGERKE